MLALIANECQNYTDPPRGAQGAHCNAARRAALGGSGTRQDAHPAVPAAGRGGRRGRGSREGGSRVRRALAAARTVLTGAIALLAGASAALAQPDNGIPEPVRAALQRAGIPLASSAVLVQEVGRQEPLVAWRAGEPMTPASVMKLVTTYAALDLLGPAYTWKTEFYAGGRSADDSIGDLYIKGYGDPTLTLERFWYLLSDLRQRGVREIRGDLVLDESWFAPQPADAGAFDGQPDRAYNIPPHALMVGFKATAVRIIGDPGQPRPRLAKLPDVPEIVLQNDIEQKPGACPADWSGGIERAVAASPGGAVVRLSGRYAAECGEHTLYVNALDNSTYIHAVFRRLWSDLGGTAPLRVRAGSVPAGTAPLLAYTSPTLAEAVRDTNKQSSNIMARQILLTLAAERTGLPGNERLAADVVRDWVGRHGLAFPELRIENGSGLSRAERISALHLGQLLVQAGRSALMPELAASLPVVGVDGTMQRRLKNSSVAGQAHIKTGYLDGVKSIAGYVLDRAGRWMAVVFLVNHAEAAAAGPAQDALLEWVYERGGYTGAANSRR